MSDVAGTYDLVPPVGAKVARKNGNIQWFATRAECDAAYEQMIAAIKLKEHHSVSLAAEEAERATMWDMP